MRAVVRPALLVGPVLGLTGFLGMMAIAFSFGEPLDGAGIVLAVGSGIALVLGLLIATPLFLAGCGVLLWLAGRNAIWTSAARWIAMGALAGSAAALVIWLAIAIEPEDDSMTAVIIVAIGAMLGALGGWLCRRILRKTIAELDAVDPQVFA